MEIVVTARHTEVSASFRRHIEEKLAKVEQLAPRAHRMEVAVSHEANRRQSGASERIELTLRGKGPVVRAEACAADPASALDISIMRLMERLRRAADRRKVHHGRHAPASVRQAGGAFADDGVTGAPGATAPEPVLDDGPPPVTVTTDHDASVVAAEYALGESPVVIRDKVHVAQPMHLDDALAEMELVGHDFYLFVDAATSCPSVAYRRHGYSYGVIRLAADLGEAEHVSRTVSERASAQTPGQPPAEAAAQAPAQAPAGAPVPVPAAVG